MAKQRAPHDVDDDDIDDEYNDPTQTDDGFEAYPDDDDDERELPADPYAKMREYLPPEVLEEIIAADDAYMEAYEAALREHYGLKPRR
jgi:hypothetical protein